MTDFGDELRASIKKKSEQLFARQMQEERLLAASKRLQDETRRAADRLCREVFGPLLQEFREVMEAAGVLCGGTVELDDGGAEVPLPASGYPGGVETTPAKAGTPTAGEYLCRYTGMGTAPGTPHFEIRIASVATPEGRIDMRVECLDATAAEFSDSPRESSGGPAESSGGPPAKSLILKLAEKSVAALNVNHDAIRQWCAGLLKKCGEAVMEAGRGAGMPTN